MNDLLQEALRRETDIEVSRELKKQASDVLSVVVILAVLWWVLL